MMQQPSASEVSAALERVYARPELVERQAPWLMRTLQELWASLLSWLGDMLMRVRVPDGWSPFLVRFFVLLFLIAAAASVLYLIASALRRAEWKRRPAASPAGGPIAVQDAAAWEIAARAAMADGRLREAAIAYYNAAVQRLDERGVLRFHAAKTPGDYRREARADDTMALVFDRIVRLFLPLAFGPAAPDAAALEALRTAVRDAGVHA